MVAGRGAAPAEMQDTGLCVKPHQPHLKTTSEFHSIALKWKHGGPSPPSSAGGMGDTTTPHPTLEEGWG